MLLFPLGASQCQGKGRVRPRKVITVNRSDASTKGGIVVGDTVSLGFDDEKQETS